MRRHPYNCAFETGTGTEIITAVRNRQRFSKSFRYQERSCVLCELKAKPHETISFARVKMYRFVTSRILNP
jgi:hypothetical protein